MDDLMNRQKNFIDEIAGKISIDEEAVSELCMGCDLMILVDTNIIIDIWKNKVEYIIQLFEKEAVCICGIIRSELMHAAYSKKS